MVEKSSSSKKIKSKAKPRRKNLSIGEIAGKVIGAVKRTISGGANGDKEKKKLPFGGRGGRRKKPTAEEIKLQETE